MNGAHQLLMVTVNRESGLLFAIHKTCKLYLDPLEQHTGEARSELPDMVQGESTKINDDNDTGNLGARLKDGSFQTDQHPSKKIRQRTLLGLPFVYKYQQDYSYNTVIK